MRKVMALVLCCALLLAMLPPVSARQTEGRFALAAVSANGVIIAPTFISATPGQTVAEALLASDHSFSGLEQGFIYEIDGVAATFTLFYDENGGDLNVEAAQITALCIGVTSQYSEALLELIVAMAQFREMGNVQQYPAAKAAYETGLDVLRSGGAEEARSAREALETAIAEYEGAQNGAKHTLTISALQEGALLSNPVVTLTDAYGNETAVTGTRLEAVSGTYRFCVSDGGYNRTEGTVTLTEDATLEVELPGGEWFGEVRLLDSGKSPFPSERNTAAHRVVFQIPDTAGELGSVYLNVAQGAVPDKNATKLKSIYTGTNGTDYSIHNRSWESTSTALTYLVSQGMEGRDFRLEAQYLDVRGHTRIQSYAVTVERTPTLSALTVTAAGTLLPLAFDPTTYTYSLATVSDEVEIAAQPFDPSYRLSGTGRVSAGGQHTITVSSGERRTSYIVTVTQKEAAKVELTVPAGVTVVVENSAGSAVAPRDGVYFLVPGEEYTYRATKGTYYHTEATFTAADSLHITVKTPVTEDWLEALALYDGGNAQTRGSYTGDTPFVPERHSYVVTVPDCNTALYVQCTSAQTVTASYLTQTTAPSTHGKPKTVTVDTAVDGGGSARILSQCLAKCGYGNTITLRLSRDDGEVTFCQDYVLTVVRELHLTALSAGEEDGELTFLDEAGNACGFDRNNTAYTVEVEQSVTTLFLSAVFPNVSTTTACCGGYYAVVNGVRQEALEALPVTLEPDRSRETVQVQVCHADGTARSQTYTITVKKTEPVAVTFRTVPEDAVVFLVNDLNGKRIRQTEGHFGLTPGGTYSYRVTCAGYQGITGTLIAPAEEMSIDISLKKAPENTSLQQLSSQWPHLRQNSDNNGVIDAPSPVAAEDAVLYWATKIGDGYDKNACGCPILVDGYLYTYAGSTVYKVDTVSGEIVATGAMDHASSFAINPPTYADGMLFIGLADGTIQAFNAATLESLWLYHDPLGGQSNSSIIYHEGYIYTGFWVGETSLANFVCISATDEDPTREKEEKLSTWSYTSAGGFYWAGAYVCGDYLLVGTDDGASGYTRGKARLLSFSPRDGLLLDEWTLEVPGDIRSSITAWDGSFYFTNKGGYFFRAEVSETGKIEKIRALALSNGANDAARPPMSTCTPTIYNGRAYVGISGTSQFGAYSGHNITVIDIPNWEIAYQVATQGYPQTSGVLTTAYEEETGCVYVYFFDNYTPGKLRMLEDCPGRTRASMTTEETYTEHGILKTMETAYVLFTPDGEQAQYAICSPIVDENGTIYFKNDSGYLMALGSTVETLEITCQPEKLTYEVGECFDPKGLQVTACFTNGTRLDVTDYLRFSTEPLTPEDSDFVLTFPHVRYQNAAGAAGVEYPEPFTVLTLTVKGEIRYGDVNGDGKIDEKDVSRLLEHINTGKSLSGVQLPAADVSGDGRIDMVDISLILRYINGKIDEFPLDGEKR